MAGWSGHIGVVLPVFMRRLSENIGGGEAYIHGK